MILNNRIKLLLLGVLCLNNRAEANLGDWMQDTGVRAMAYAKEFSKNGIKFFGSDNPKLKVAFVAVVSCFLLKAAYVQKLIKDAPTKKERKKIKKQYFITSRDTSYLGLLAYTPVVGRGVGSSRAARYGEEMADSVKQYYSGQCLFFVERESAPAFSENEKQAIHAIVSQIGYNSNIVFCKEEGGNGSAWGSSKGGVINLGEQVCQNTEELKCVLGHEIVHLKKNHQKKYAIMGMLIPLGVEFGCKLLQYGTTKLTQKLRRDYAIKKKSNADNALYLVKYCIDTFANSYILKSLLSFYLLHGYMRRSEKEADIESAKALKCAEAAIQRFKNLIQANIEHRQKTPEEYDKSGNYLYGLEHPYYQERIAYLEPLAQEQAKVA